MKDITVNADGCYMPHRKVGGWAGCIHGQDSQGKPRVVELMGSVFNPHSSNQMEAIAILNTLSALQDPYTITLYTDSQGIVGSMKSYVNWVSSALEYKPKWFRGIAEEDRHKFDFLMRYHSVKFFWVKGHSLSLNNRRVDRLAKMSALSFANRLDTKGDGVSTISPTVREYKKSLEVWQL